MKPVIATLATLALSVPSVALANKMEQLMGACFAPTATSGQAATLLSTIGWQVGGDYTRAQEARAMVLPYLSGRDDQDLRRNGLEYYQQEGLVQAAEEAPLSLFLTSPDGGTLMMTHTGEQLDCTYAAAGGTLVTEITSLLPDDLSNPVSDPQMTYYRYIPNPQPQGIQRTTVNVWDPDEADYTQINPIRPRSVDLIVTVRTKM